MDLFAGRLYYLVILLLSCLPTVMSCVDVVEESPLGAESNNSSENATENSIKEMVCKLESVVTQGGFCSKQNGAETQKQCIDLTSSQSVVTQLCDRIAALDTKVNELVLKINLRPTCNPHNSKKAEDDKKPDDHDKPFTQIAKLREEIKQIKRSAVFYASRTGTLGNFTHEKILNYDASVISPYFDPINGMFITPFEGIYHFSLTYEKPEEVTLEACLIVDNSVIASSISEERRQKIELMTSLKSGQEVWTDITSNNTPTDSKVSIVFSGFLVH